MRSFSGVIRSRLLVVVTVLVLGAALSQVVGLVSAGTVSRSLAVGAMSPAVQDAQSAPDAATASAIAVAYDHPVTIENEETEQTIATAEPDGTTDVSESSGPVQVLQGGTWVPIDTSLSLGGDGMLGAAAVSVPVEFSDGGTGPMARIQATDGSWEDQIWAAGPLPSPDVEGATATYPDVFPGVNLVLTVTSTGMTEVLVITSAAAAADPQLTSITVDVDGVTLAAAADTGSSGAAQGSTAADASDGLVTPSPTWWDSSTPGSDVTGPGGDQSPMPVPDTIEPSSISIDAAAATQASAVTYPVFVDPAVNDYGHDSTYVDNAYPSQNYLNGSGASDQYVHVGYIDAGDSDDGKSHLTRGFWMVPFTGLSGAVVQSATLSATDVWSYSCSATRVDLAAVSYPYQTIDSSTTWNNQPDMGGDVTSTNASGGYDSSCPYVNYNTSFNVTAWVAARSNDQGAIFELHAHNESDPSQWKKFKNYVWLKVTLDHPPSTPSSLSVSGCHSEFNGCGQPSITSDNEGLTLTAESTDSDNDNIRYHFVLQTSSGSGINSYTSDFTASGKMNSVTTSSTAKLGDGEYRYEVQASDGQSDSNGNEIDSSYSSWFYFIVDTSAPAAPSLSESGGLSTSNGSFAGTVGVTQEKVTISESQSTDHAYGYVYAIVPSSAQVAMPTTITCNTTVNGYVEVCPASLGDPVSVTIEAPDLTSNFVAWTFDASGNTQTDSSKGPARPSNQVSFYAQRDPNVVNDIHSFRTDSAGSSSCAVQNTPDSPGSSVTEADLSASAGAPCSAFDPTAPSATGGNPVPNGNGTVTLDGQSSQSSAASLLDTSKNFSVGGWFKPSASLGTGSYTVMSQDPGSGEQNSGFYLKIQNNEWNFCVSTETSSPSLRCATAAATTGSGWQFVSGEFDAQDSELLLRVSTTDAQPTPIIGSFVSPGSGGPSATGPLTIGRSVYHGSSGDYFVGEVLDPFSVQSVVDDGELAELADLDYPALL